MNTTRILIVLFTLVIISACEREGCTDKDALNFDISADNDDGSCIHCPAGSGASILLDYGIVKEMRPNSDYLDMDILDIEIEQVGVNISDIANCNSIEQSCMLQITFKNVSGVTLQNFQVYISASNSQIAIENNFYLNTLNPNTQAQQNIFVGGGGGMQECIPITEYGNLNFYISGGYYQ
ncbi:hypothetical protein G3O08_15670 [Cryomorpha ignava]|uniref:Uncharacterized protein n=1 Tax=Cryomorpha ignava TaxID=101383 RepID=A0A7K3WTB9_9FLAO|nr:hypothetical protein [Cryomorpha ignava]NEN24939.1 hypothetical protein [Cryomorpha ignava]